jgi:hypothetical protein
MNIRKILLTLVVGGLTFSGAAIAQDDDSHGLINVFMTQVKPGKVPEYMELIGQLTAARKAAGHTGVDVYQVIRGVAGRFYSVTSGDNYADLGQPFESGMSAGDFARWVARVTDVVDHNQLTVLRTHGELLIASDSDSAANLIQLRYTTLKPGYGGEYHEWLAESLVPALREGNTKGWNVSTVRLGDDPNTWISARRLDSWADLDEPGQFSHMSERARNNLFDGNGDRVDSSWVELLRYLPDLSY